MSERDLITAIKNELDSDRIHLALIVEIIFDDGPFRVWSGLGPRTFFGVNFDGVGSLGGIDKIEEEAGDIKASGIALSLTGIPVSYLSLTLQENFQGRPISIWLQIFDIDWGTIGDPIKLNKYKCDYPVIDKGGETFMITVYAESMLADLERPRVQRYTHEAQQVLYPGDMGLEFVAMIQKQEIIWKAPM